MIFKKRVLKNVFDIYSRVIYLLKGCYDTLVEDAKEKFAIIGGIALGIAVFQVCINLLTINVPLI